MTAPVVSAEDFPCDTCGHLALVHRSDGRCRSTPRGCACTGYHSEDATAAYVKALEARLRAVWAYLPEIAPYVPSPALAPLYALTDLCTGQLPERTPAA